MESAVFREAVEDIYTLYLWVVVLPISERNSYMILLLVYELPQLRISNTC